MAAWWEDEAATLGKRKVQPERTRPILFETGYGPSGLPHLGTFAEVARTAFVRWAFQRQYPHVASRQLAFSDDMDGLRGVPENVPNREMLREHLAKPLSRIPDPFGEAESFSAYMISKLKDFLGNFGFDTEFMASSDAYASGQFDLGLQRLLERDEQVKQVVLPTLQPETRLTWSPFLPICERCGRFTTRVLETRPESGSILYVCDAEFGGASGCGHRGDTPVTGGRVKVGWKVDWALRWYVLGVDYEMYGKDLIESAAVSTSIVKVLGGRPPMGTFYELFLDEEGHKISKKIGNGIAFDDWLRYAPADSILYFLTKPPRKARRIGLDLVGRSVDEFIALLREPAEFAGDIEMMSAVAPQISRPHQWKWRSSFDYSLTTSLVGALGVEDPAFIQQFFAETTAIEVADADVAYNNELIRYAIEYDRALKNRRLKELGLAQGQQSARALTEDERAAMGELIQSLESADFDDAEALQSLVFQAGKSRELKAKGWFAVLYVALTGNNSGPRLGTLLSMLGQERALQKLRAAQ